MSLKNKKIFYVLIVTIVLIAISLFFVKQSHNGSQIACTLEAKICPDGSSVGRVAPNCEFAPCTNSIQGNDLENTVPEINTPITANFEIYTNGTKRIFTNAMYHNLESDLYIDASDPSVIHSTKQGATWADFFETLPMSLTEDCLVTGTRQEFCSGTNGKLNFYLNGNQIANVLNKQIINGDTLIVRYE